MIQRSGNSGWRDFIPHLFVFGWALGHLGNQIAARFTTSDVAGFATSVTLILLTYVVINAIVLASSFVWQSITQLRKQDKEGNNT